MYTKILLCPLILYYILFQTANALKEDGTRLWCYECNGLDNNCTVGLLGTKKECPPSTTSCYKSWTVETSPKTKRKCADDRKYETKCNDALYGQMSMLACYCKEDFCNSAMKIQNTIWILGVPFIYTAIVKHFLY